MIYLALQDFFVHHAYIIEMLIFIALFCHFFERRQMFVLRFLVVLVCLFSSSLVLYELKSLYEGSASALIVYSMAKYLFMIALNYLGILFCLKARKLAALFSIICAIATHYVAHSIYSSVLAATGLGYDSIFAFFVVIIVSCVVYFLAYVIMVQKIKKAPERCFENRLNVFLGGLLILCINTLQFLIEPHVSMHDMPVLYILISCYAILCCIFTLIIEYGLFQNKVLANDKEILEHLMHEHEIQYHTSKANVEMINIKCHDMKHQISKMTGRADPEFISELENIINIYDSALKTGNEVLDVFLMEKKLLCEKNEIKFDCIVDGASLDFMESPDIYSLFGNAIDNAIEALCKIENKEKRIIGLNVKVQMGMIIIHIENYYEEELTFVDGIPKTSKRDENYHGFGVKSIKMIVERYDGHMTVLARDGIFNLNITIPIPER